MVPTKIRRRPVESPRADQFILALLQHPTLEMAAQSTGINPATAWRWMQHEEFQERYREARRKTFNHAIARLQHASAAAASTLLKVMIDPEAPAYSRVRAADVVLTHALRAIETEDIEVRVARLEAAGSKVRT